MTTNTTEEKKINRIEIKDGRAYLHRERVYDGITHIFVDALGSNANLIKKTMDTFGAEVVFLD